MSEVRASDVKSIYEMLQALHNWGIQEEDIIILILNRCKNPKPSKKTIREVIKALKHIEENIFMKIEKGRMLNAEETIS